jgi:hypothetical protein
VKLSLKLTAVVLATLNIGNGDLQDGIQ